MTFDHMTCPKIVPSPVSFLSCKSNYFNVLWVLVSVTLLYICRHVWPALLGALSGNGEQHTVVLEELQGLEQES